MTRSTYRPYLPIGRGPSGITHRNQQNSPRADVQARPVAPGAPIFTPERCLFEAREAMSHMAFGVAEQWCIEALKQRPGWDRAEQFLDHIDAAQTSQTMIALAGAVSTALTAGAPISHDSTNTSPVADRVLSGRLPVAVPNSE